jgi:hypothetical protein
MPNTQFSLDFLIIPSWQLSTTEFEDIFLSSSTTIYDGKFDDTTSKAFPSFSTSYESLMSSRRASMSLTSPLSINTTASSISDPHSAALVPWNHTCDICTDLQREKQISISPDEISLFDFGLEAEQYNESLVSSSSRSSSVSSFSLESPTQKERGRISDYFCSKGGDTSSWSTPSSTSSPVSPNTALFSIPPTRGQSIASSPWTCLEDAHHPLCDGECDNRVDATAVSFLRQSTSSSSTFRRKSWYAATFRESESTKQADVKGHEQYSWLDVPPRLVRRVSSTADEGKMPTTSSRRQNRFERRALELSRK